MSIVTNGSLIPNVSGAPLDARAVCQDLSGLKSVENPYVGLRVWVSDIGKEVIVKTLDTVGAGIFAKKVIGEIEYAAGKSDFSTLSLSKPTGKRHLIVSASGNILVDTSKGSADDVVVRYYVKSSENGLGSWETLAGLDGIPESADNSIVALDLSSISDFPVVLNYAWFTDSEDVKDWHGLIFPSTTAPAYTEKNSEDPGLPPGIADCPNSSGYVDITVDDEDATTIELDSDAVPVYVEVDEHLYSVEGVFRSDNKYIIPLDPVLAAANKAEVSGVYRVWLSAGPKGGDGHSPKKGVDYFTEEDVDSIISEVVDRLSGSDSGPSNPPEGDEGDGSSGQTKYADSIIFKDAVYTSYAIGNIQLTNGLGVLAEAGDSLVDVLNRVFVKEVYPEIKQPSVSINFGVSGTYEVGTKVSSAYSIEFYPGSYQFGAKDDEGNVVKDTGVTVSDINIFDTLGNSSQGSSGTLATFSVSDNIDYYVTAEVSYTGGYTPLTNMKNAYTIGKIQQGTVAKTSSSIKGYRNSFYGTTQDKEELSSDSIRGLSRSGKALTNGDTINLTIQKGALRAVVAYPDTLRDLTSVKDVNGLNAEIVSAFKKTLIDVEGSEGFTPIKYKVYTIEFASANEETNTYVITI